MRACQVYDDEGLYLKPLPFCETLIALARGINEKGYNTDQARWAKSRRNSTDLLFSTSFHHVVRSSNDASKRPPSIDGGNETLAILDLGFLYLLLPFKFKLPKEGQR